MCDETRPITVLFVDDEPDFVELVSMILEREGEAITVETAASVEAGIELLDGGVSAEGAAIREDAARADGASATVATEAPTEGARHARTGGIDCVLSDYRMPDADGLDFLRRVRDEYGDLPFILFTGAGDEAVASEAISAGVTDYVRKGGGNDRFRLLADRIESVVSRRRTERALRESERRRSALLDNFPGIAYRYRPTPEWEVEFVSDGCRELTGYAPADLEGDVNWLGDVVHPADRDAVRAGAAALEADGGAEFAYRILTKDGTQRWIREQSRRVGDGGDVVEGFLTDVTERKELEGELRREQTFVENALDGLRDMFFAFDETGDIRRWNERCREVTGYDDETIASMDPLDFVAPDHADRVAESIERAYECGSATVEADVQTRDGERIPYEFVGSLVPGDDDPRVLCGIARDVSAQKEYERTLAALHVATRDLLRADSADEIYELAVDIAADVLDLPLVSVHAYSEEERVLAPVAYTADVPSTFGDVPAFRVGDSLAWDCFVSGDSNYFPDVRETEATLNPDTPVRSELQVPVGDHGIVVAASTAVDDFDGADVESTRILASNVEAALDRLDRLAEIRSQKSELVRRNEELSRLVSINDVLRGVPMEVTTTTTLDGFKSAVCERLVDADEFGVAWFGDYDDASESVSLGAVAGVDGDVDQLCDADSPALELAARAAADGEPRVVSDVLDAPEWDDRRETVFACGFRSVAAIPIETETRVHGVVVVHACSPDAFDDRILTVLADLGTIVAHVVEARKHRRSLHSDVRTELELRISDDELPFNRLSTLADGDVELHGFFPVSEEAMAGFVSVAGPVPDDLVRVVEEWTSVERVVRMSDAEEDAVFEIRFSSLSLLDALLDADGELRSLVARDGETTAVAAFPQTVGVRSLVDRLSDTYPVTDLLAQRETKKRERTPRTFRARLREELTPRQYETLQTAYYAGFFEWPRDATGEAIAQTLDIKAPTFHYHLRAAHRTLMDLVLDP